MEGGDPTGVIINHPGSKTFKTVIGGRGQGKGGRGEIKRPLMRLSTYTIAPVERSFSAVGSLPASKVTGFLSLTSALFGDYSQQMAEEA